MRTLEQLVGPAQFATFGQDWEYRTKPLTDRPGDEIFFILHHSVSRTIRAIMAEFTSPNRTLSATVACGPDTAGVDNYRQINAVPWNTGRPYTTSSWIDDQAITTEMANLALTPPWPVGATGKQWAAEVVAAMHVELGMPIDEWHVLDHQTVYRRGWDSYPTECCGADLRGAIADILAEARRIVTANGGSNNQEDDMTVTHKVQTDGRDRDLKPGTVYPVYIDGTSKSTAITVGGTAPQRATGALTLCFTAELGATVTTRLQRYRLENGVVKIISEMPPVEHLSGPGQTWAQHSFARGVGNGERLRFVVWTDKPAKQLFTEIESVVIS